MILRDNRENCMYYRLGHNCYTKANYFRNQEKSLRINNDEPRKFAKLKLFVLIDLIRQIVSRIWMGNYKCILLTYTKVLLFNYLLFRRLCGFRHVLCLKFNLQLKLI